MAQVFDLVEQNKKKTQPVQQLAGEAGLPVAPVTAVGTGTLGGTPQQQAMAGTPAQKKSVLESVTKVAKPTGETQLEQATLLRAPAKETTQDIAAKSKVQQLVQSTGTFGAKVSELIDNALTKMTTPAQPTAATPTTTTTTPTPTMTLETALDTIPEANRATVDALLKQIASASDTTSPSRNELLAKLNVAMGKTPGQPLDAEAVSKLYADVQATVKKQAEDKFKAAAMGTDSKLTLSDFEALGTSVDDVASLLGITPEEAGNLSVTDFQNKLAGLDVGTKEVQATTAGMSGTSLLSTAERQALRGVLTQLEERGLAGADIQYASLLKDIDAGTQVSIGGTQYGIDELLSDGAFAKIADQYLSNPNDPWAKQLAAAEPALVKFLTDNRDGLQKLINDAKTATTAFGGLQADRAKLFEGLSPEMVKSLTGIDLGQFATTAVDVTKLPAAVQELSKLPAGQRTTYANNLTTLSDVMGPDYIKGLKPETLAAMKLSDPNGPGARWMTIVSDVKSRLTDANPETVLDAITDGTMDIDDIDAQLAEDNFRIAMGLPASGLGSLDTNKDGKVSREEITAAGKSATNSLPSFDDYNTGKWKGIDKVTTSPTRGDQNLETAYDVLKDGKIEEGEKLVLAGVNTDALQGVLDKLVSSKSIKGESARALAEIVGQKTTDDANSALAGYTIYGDNIPLTVDSVTEMINSNNRGFGFDNIDAWVAREALKEAINKAPSKGAKSQLEYLLGVLVENISASQNQQPAATPASSEQYRPTAYNPEVTRETFEGL
jgi:hypothetical protein